MIPEMNIRPFFFVFFALSCSKEKVILEKEALINEKVGWIFSDSLGVSFSVSDTTRFYAMRFQLDFNSRFPYENVYTRIHTQFPDGKRISQVLSLQLTDQRGAWAGRCNKNYCRVEIPLQEYIMFPSMGKYNISMAQYSRSDTLQGVLKGKFLLIDMGARKLP
jgi:gliding motility-associated lipoprotein GldH